LAEKNFKKQFRGVTIDYLEGFIRVSVDFKEPKDSNSVMVDISKNSVSIQRTLRDGGEFIASFDHW
jgi:hypothetical protein